MTTQSILRISGTTADEIYNFNVNRSYSDNNSSSYFDATIDNLDGKNKADFTIGDNISILADNGIVDGLVAHWQMTETSGPKLFEPINRQHGLLISGTRKLDVVGGQQFYSIQLDSIDGVAGSRFVDTGSILNVFPSGEGTVNYWAKYLNQSILGRNNFYIGSSNDMDFNGGGGADEGLYFLTALGNNTFRVFQSGANIINAGGGGTLSNNVWHMITATWTGSNTKAYYYQNGQQVSNDTQTDNIALTNWRRGGFAPYTGSIVVTDLRVFNRALGTSEVSTLYNGGSKTFGGKIFEGILEDANYSSVNMHDKIKLSGRDYSLRLQDRTVEPEVYTNLLAGSIVKDIINKYTDDITVFNVQESPTTIQRIAFNQSNVYDAIRELSELSNYCFYIDTSRDLHFEPCSTTNSYLTFYSGNVIDAKFKQQRDTVYNQVWVYGDRYLDGFQETFNAGSPLGGSIFTLLYKPHNTSITVSGGVIQPGAIEGITSSPTSGTKYLVSYQDKKIVFTSGTELGANIPTSGNAVVITYNRLLPIVKVGDNEVSKLAYGQRNKIIIDKDIKDPSTAADIMQSVLKDNSDPKIEANLDVKGFYNAIPSNTCIVDYPNNNINSNIFDILEAKYSFNKNNNLIDETLSLKASEKINDITDTIKEMINNLKKIQSSDIDNSDAITRFQYTTGSFGVRQSGLIVSTISPGSSFILGTGYHGVSGTTYGGILGSIIESGINLLGNFKDTPIVIFSGGYF